jgi:hypothetical protein
MASFWKHHKLNPSPDQVAKYVNRSPDGHVVATVTRNDDLIVQKGKVPIAGRGKVMDIPPAIRKQYTQDPIAHVMLKGDGTYRTQYTRSGGMAEHEKISKVIERAGFIRKEPIGTTYAWLHEQKLARAAGKGVAGIALGTLGLGVASMLASRNASAATTAHGEEAHAAMQALPKLWDKQATVNAVGTGAVLGTVGATALYGAKKALPHIVRALPGISSGIGAVSGALEDSHKPGRGAARGALDGALSFVDPTAWVNPMAAAKTYRETGSVGQAAVSAVSSRGMFQTAIGNIYDKAFGKAESNAQHYHQAINTANFNAQNRILHMAGARPASSGDTFERTRHSRSGKEVHEVVRKGRRGHGAHHDVGRQVTRKAA